MTCDISCAQRNLSDQKQKQLLNLTFAQQGDDVAYRTMEIVFLIGHCWPAQRFMDLIKIDN